ncbi:bacterio-opsin activator domain-containing protein [Haloarcula nitratireducens]|uniref:Helix-turn-helix domain-containing protein n=1 Tax=Haloarcula nitratireducens TaxID=2487749 RepID=A0AAW4PBV6_9EURY|nr:bacterio-opsin activator domain-containing protein [Halomicroarcula nitratireducens]MBX0295203.1 helix-turn-helix domain-containing protein [Halomicroarcula nitratireducens]
MKPPETLARATLDTLPINVAVLDDDGTILVTNRAWREFAGVDNGDMQGVNYFETTDVEADEYAAEAVAGLKAVMDGDRDLFTLEYPCHTAEEKQWFLMRVAPLPPEEAGSVVVAHVDITQRKLAELDAERRSEQLQAERSKLEHLLDRLDGLVTAVVGDVMTAGSRSEIQQAVVDRLASVDSYRFAWIAEFDVRDETLRPAAVSTAGPDGDGTDVGIPMTDDDPVAVAARTEAIQVETGEIRAVHRELAGEDVASLAAVPLVAGESLYGVLTVYADRGDVFDPRERAVLGAVGQAVSTAIDATETSRLLRADNFTELELQIRDDDVFFLSLARELGCRMEYGGSVAGDEESAMFFLVETDDPTAVCATAADHPQVSAVTHVSTTESTSLFEFAVADPPVVSLLADRGAETRDIVVTPDHAVVTAVLPAATETRAVVEHVRDAYPGTDLLSVRDRDEPPMSRQAFLATLEDELTNRQLTALRKGYLGGFFEWPRDISGEELAESMDICPSTFHQHLRAGERKLLEAVFETW